MRNGFIELYFILYFGLYLKTDEIILYLLRIVICFVLVSCTDGRSEGQVARLLRQAEMCMEECPDSALVYLHQIPDPGKVDGRKPS